MEPRRLLSGSLPAAAIAYGGVIAAWLICGGLLVYGAGRGADLTDEIFYLIWARDPDAYALIYQPFGYLLHPLFRLVGGDLRLYRLAGFAIAAGAGAVLGGALATGRVRRGLFALYGALAALTIFFPWIITPSYNSAANVGAMLVIAGAATLAARPERRFASIAASATGLCVAAFAKPPLFAIAVLVLLGAAAMARNRRATVIVATSLALAAVLMGLLLAPTAWPALIARMAASQHVLALPNTPSALPIKVVRDWRLVPPALTGAAVAAALGLLTSRYRWSSWLGHAAIVLSLVYIAGIVGDAIDGAIPDFIGLALVTLAAGYAGVLGWRGGGGGFATALLLGAPIAVALGTFNNQWAQLNFSMAFPFTAVFALAWRDPLRWRQAIAHALAIAGPVAVMVLAACFPYSLPASVFEQQVAVAHPVTHDSILVDPETAAFVGAAQGRAAGALLIDLSGTGPGVAAVLGARAPVLPWLNPATASWPDVVWSRLSPAERDRAWFVGPILPLFARSAPARWFVAHRARYCPQPALPEMPFWGEDHSLLVWRPCAAGTGRAS